MQPGLWQFIHLIYAPTIIIIVGGTGVWMETVFPAICHVSWAESVVLPPAPAKTSSRPPAWATNECQLRWQNLWDSCSACKRRHKTPAAKIFALTSVCQLADSSFGNCDGKSNFISGGLGFKLPKLPHCGSPLWGSRVQCTRRWGANVHAGRVLYFNSLLHEGRNSWNVQQPFFRMCVCRTRINNNSFAKKRINEKKLHWQNIYSHQSYLKSTTKGWFLFLRTSSSAGQNRVHLFNTLTHAVSVSLYEPWHPWSSALCMGLYPAIIHMLDDAIGIYLRCQLAIVSTYFCGPPSCRLCMVHAGALNGNAQNGLPGKTLALAFLPHPWPIDTSCASPIDRCSF